MESNVEVSLAKRRVTACPNNPTPGGGNQNIKTSSSEDITRCNDETTLFTIAEVST